MLGHGASCIGCEPLQPGRRIRLAHDEEAALGRTVAPDGIDDLGDGRRLLANGGIDTDHVARPLVDNGVDGYRRLARSTIARSEEHTSELQSLMRISYAVFCLKKK